MEKLVKAQEQTRGQFLKQLGLSGASLMAIYCMGTTMSSCSSKKDDPSPVAPSTGGTTSTKIDFILDFTTADFSKLKTAGEFAIKGSVIVVNSLGTYVALSKVCTHEGTTIDYRKDSNDFLCPNHGSEFNIDGTVKKSPAASSLKTYKTEVQDSGNKLRVFE